MDCTELFVGVSFYAGFFFTLNCDVSFHSAGNENNRLCSALLAEHNIQHVLSEVSVCGNIVHHRVQSCASPLARLKNF